MTLPDAVRLFPQTGGIVIGERSYGKGVAQIVYDGTNCPYLTDDAVKLTAYRFYCAGGNTSDRVGDLD